VQLGQWGGGEQRASGAASHPSGEIRPASILVAISRAGSKQIVLHARHQHAILPSFHHGSYPHCVIHQSPEFPFRFIWVLGWSTWHLALDPSSVLYLQHSNTSYVRILVSSCVVCIRLLLHPQLRSSSFHIACPASGKPNSGGEPRHGGFRLLYIGAKKYERKREGRGEEGREWLLSANKKTSELRLTNLSLTYHFSVTPRIENEPLTLARRRI
jgi:hypothetical protein